MLYIKATEDGDYDAEENLNNSEYKAAYERYLSQARSRGETAISMNMFLNTVLPVQTQIQKNRDDAYTDLFDGFKTVHEILKEHLDYINDALPPATLITMVAAPQAIPATVSLALTIALYLELAEVCSNTIASAVDLIEKLLIDDLLEEETSFSTYENEISGIFGDLLSMAESFIDRKSGNVLKVSEKLYAALGKESVDEAKKEIKKEIKQEVLDASKKALKQELSDAAEDAAEKTLKNTAKNKTKDIVSDLAETIEKQKINDKIKISNGSKIDLARYGDNLGKMGTYVESPNIKVDWSKYAEHGFERMQQRGMTQEMVDQILSNGKVLSQNNGNKFAFITREGVAIVSKDGKLITAWSSNYYDNSMHEIIIKLFGE